jgi:hypothetical protein
MAVPSYVPAGAAPFVQNLLRYAAHSIPDPFDADISFRSAVLVLLMPGETDGLDVVLTVRTTKMRRNAGEVACPGGWYELDGESMAGKLTFKFCIPGLDAFIWCIVGSKLLGTSDTVLKRV